MKALLDIIGAVIFHIIVVAFLGLIGFFVWNSGVVSLIPKLPNITYITASAIMLGLYVVNMFVKIQVNRILVLRKQKYMIDKIVKFYKDNAPKG